jgi:hypothetical protein
VRNVVLSRYMLSTSVVQLREASQMGTFALNRHAVSIVVAAALLTACGGSQPPIGAPGAIPQGRAIATHAEPSGSCSSQYLECVKLAYGSPIEQELCLPVKGHLVIGSSCDPRTGTWYWYTKVYGRRRKWIEASVAPNPGNPVELTISETQGFKSSHGKIVDAVSLKICESNGCAVLGRIGISTK